MRAVKWLSGVLIRLIGTRAYLKIPQSLRRRLGMVCGEDMSALIQSLERLRRVIPVPTFDETQAMRREIERRLAAAKDAVGGEEPAVPSVINKRCKILWLTPEAAFALMTGRARLVGLPFDAGVREHGVFVDNRRAISDEASVGFKVTHPSFPVVSEGCEYPALDASEARVEPVPQSQSERDELWAKFLATQAELRGKSEALKAEWHKLTAE